MLNSIFALVGCHNYAFQLAFIAQRYNWFAKTKQPPRFATFAMYSIVAFLLCGLCAAARKRKASAHPCENVLSVQMLKQLGQSGKSLNKYTLSSILSSLAPVSPSNKDCFDYIKSTELNKQNIQGVLELVLSDNTATFDESRAQFIDLFFDDDWQDELSGLAIKIMKAQHCEQLKYLLHMNEMHNYSIVPYGKIILDSFFHGSVDLTNLDSYGYMHTCYPLLFESFTKSITKLNSFDSLIIASEILSPSSTESLLPQIISLARRLMTPETVTNVAQLRISQTSIAAILCAMAHDALKQPDIPKMQIWQSISWQIHDIAESALRRYEWELIKNVYNNPHSPLAAMFKLSGLYYKSIVFWAAHDRGLDEIFESVSNMFTGEKLELLENIKKVVDPDHMSTSLQQFYDDYDPESMTLTVVREDANVVDRNGESIQTYILNLEIGDIMTICDWLCKGMHNLDECATRYEYFSYYQTIAQRSTTYNVLRQPCVAEKPIAALAQHDAIEATTSYTTGDHPALDKFDGIVDVQVVRKKTPPLVDLVDGSGDEAEEDMQVSVRVKAEPGLLESDD